MLHFILGDTLVLRMRRCVFGSWRSSPTSLGQSLSHIFCWTGLRARWQGAPRLLLISALISLLELQMPLYLALSMGSQDLTDVLSLLRLVLLSPDPSSQPKVLVF